MAIYLSIYFYYLAGALYAVSHTLSRFLIGVNSKDNFYTAQIELKNNSSNISLLNKIKLKDKETGESVLPVFFDDDYISILPNEKRTINLKVDKKYLVNKNVEMHLEGWNTKPVKLDVNQ